MYDPNEYKNIEDNSESTENPESENVIPLGDGTPQASETPEVNEAPEMTETPETQENESGGYYTAVSGSSYSYEPETQYNNPGYSEANYTPVGDGHSRTPRYYYLEETSEKKRKKKDESSGGGVSMKQLVAACLVCAVLGGGVGGIGTGLLSRGNGNTADVPEVPAVTDSGSLAITNGNEEKIPDPSAGQSTVKNLSAEEMTANAIYDLACTQVVGIRSEITYTSWFGTSSSAVSGSGFIISSDGYILTNYHVIEKSYKGGYDISVMLFNGDEYKASIVGFEADNDVAVLKIDAEGLNAVTLGDSNSMSVGETVYAVGNPLGELAYTMTKGMVSALDRELTNTDQSTGTTTTINMFQIDAAVNSGNSGGPVYNGKGEVIGIVTAKYSDSGIEGLGFAIPINDAKSISDDLITKGYVSGKAYFGITVQTVTKNIAEYFNMVEGAYISAVDDNSCAGTAGLMVGDIIIKLDDREITSSSDLKSAKKNYKAGDTATLVVYRSGEEVELTIVFDEEKPVETASKSPEPTPEPDETTPSAWSTPDDDERAIGDGKNANLTPYIEIVPNG